MRLPDAHRPRLRALGRATSATRRNGRADLVPARGRHDPRRHRRHERIVEVAEQRLEPPVGRARSRSPRRPRAALSTAAKPALRAPAGPTLVASPTKRAPCRSAISLVAPASADASSTTMQASPSSAPSSRSSCAGRSRTGTTTVTSPGPRVPPSGRGRERAGRHQPARQQLRRAARGPTGAPALQRATSLTGPLGNPEQAERAAAEQHGPAVEVLRRGVLGQGEGAGQRGRGPGGGGPQRGGHPGCAGLGHRPILAVRGRG